MPDLEVVAQRLRKLRGDKSREEVASAVNISLSALAMYETGARMPRDEIKVALAKYYSSSVEAIFFNLKSTNRDFI
ncbi:helix-turn-helix transcriptional regulator [Clostridium minihomine]|uniref:helix-turn-helix transcriptional regulator n=1 Tax=Clostridium minihomine TaxID=2045012 RepID=UPI000C765EF4|nr:helix-turn-helix transcriptional regulator [Clostridium minihomine]